MEILDTLKMRNSGERLYQVSLILLVATGVCLCQSVKSGSSGPVLGYKLVDWPTQAQSVAGAPAGPWNFIQAPAVAVISNGNIIVLHRGAHPIMEFEPGGKFVRSWGDRLISEGKVVSVAPQLRRPGSSGYSAVYGPAGCTSCGAHSVRTDPDGNLWVVDATGHIVYKMNQGRVTMRIGRQGVSGMGHDTFNLPTDVAFGSNGDIYVSDGYGNARVVKYSKDGKYILQWGRRGSGPGEFQLPHNLVVDSRDRVYVTDRDNRRVQVFDSSGKFLSQWPTETGVSTLLLTKDQKIWAGGVLRNLDGTVVGRLPETGGHGTAVTASGDVYLGQLSGIVQKFVKQ